MRTTITLFLLFHKKIDDCGRLQGHYRLDKFQIQPEFDIAQQLERQDQKIKE
jgi:hypothetical protein